MAMPCEQVAEENAGTMSNENMEELKESITAKEQIISRLHQVRLSDQYYCGNEVGASRVVCPAVDAAEVALCNMFLEKRKVVIICPPNNPSYSPQIVISEMKTPFPRD